MSAEFHYIYRDGTSYQSHADFNTIEFIINPVQVKSLDIKLWTCHEFFHSEFAVINITVPQFPVFFTTFKPHSVTNLYWDLQLAESDSTRNSTYNLYNTLFTIGKPKKQQFFFLYDKMFLSAGQHTCCENEHLRLQMGVYNTTIGKLVLRDKLINPPMIVIGSFNMSGNDARLKCTQRSKNYKLISNANLYLDLRFYGNWFTYDTRYSNNQLAQRIPVGDFAGFIVDFSFDMLDKQASTWTCESARSFMRFNNYQYIKLCRGEACTVTHFLQSEHMDLIRTLNQRVLCDHDLEFVLNGISKHTYFCGLVQLVPNSKKVYSIIFPCAIELYNVGVLCSDNTNTESEAKLKTFAKVPYDRHATFDHIVEKFEVFSRKLSQKEDKSATWEDYQPYFWKFKFNMFMCEDGTHILTHHVCDGVIDCPDAADESDCSDVCVVQTSASHELSCFTQCAGHKNCYCSEHYFQCADGGCVPVSKICDCFKDCPEGSDEVPSLCPYLLCDVYNQILHTESYII